MEYFPQKFEKLVGAEGFSEQLLRNHFALYEGYVANVNKIVGSIVSCLDDDRSATPEFAEVMRRFGWEFDGMRLHELYFGNLKKEGSRLDMESSLGRKLIEEFGSFERWEKHFRATGAMRGIGWVVLYQDDMTGTMYNVWINEHDGGHMTGAKPLLVMDVFEHAYALDYGTKKAEYIEAFMKMIDWDAVSKRFGT
jgi:Fe-Mn family superoxide dismutase